MNSERFFCFRDPQTKAKVYTHTSLLEPEQASQAKKLLDTSFSKLNYSAIFYFYLSMEAVNRIKMLAKLDLLKRVGFVFGSTMLAAYATQAAYSQYIILPELQRIMHGAPVFDNLKDVPELNKAFFFLDDDNNYEPSLWHHSMYSLFETLRERMRGFWGYFGNRTKPRRNFRFFHNSH